MSTPIVATLIGSPEATSLTPELAEHAAAAVDAHHVYFLADGIACDVVLPDAMPDTMPDAMPDRATAIRDALLAALDEAPIDVVVQPQDTRRKKLLIADMDSTMIEQECVDELADEAGYGSRVAAITEAAMRGGIEFDQALRDRVALLAGLPVSVIADVIERRIRHASGGRTLVATMRANGAHTALVSGGFTAFTEPVGTALGFDENRANVLDVEGNRLTGTVREPILGSDAKVQALREITSIRGLDVSDALAVGDGANDLAMLQLAGTGIALHAKPLVARAAKHRIDHGDLTALLYVQGYRASEFR